MSRIGRLHIGVPADVDVTIDGQNVTGWQSHRRTAMGMGLPPGMLYAKTPHPRMSSPGDPIQRLIRELSNTLGVTSIVVSHDLVSIFTIADRIVMLYKGLVRVPSMRTRPL